MKRFDDVSRKNKQRFVLRHGWLVPGKSQIFFLITHDRNVQFCDINKRVIWTSRWSCFWKAYYHEYPWIFMIAASVKFLIFSLQFWSIYFFKINYAPTDTLVLSALGFNARVGNLSRTSYMFPAIHLWCDACRPLGIILYCMTESSADRLRSNYMYLLLRLSYPKYHLKYSCVLLWCKLELVSFSNSKCILM